jgi:hypothetical protein
LRDELFTMRMSKEERSRLDRAATHRGMKAAQLIRAWLEREEKAIGADRLAAHDASTFAEAQALYESSGGRDRGDAAESQFYEENGERRYALQTRTLILETFRVMKNGRLRVDR